MSLVICFFMVCRGVLLIYILHFNLPEIMLLAMEEGLNYTKERLYLSMAEENSIFMAYSIWFSIFIH